MPTFTFKQAQSWFGIEKVEPITVTWETFQYAGDDLGQLRKRQTKIEGTVWNVGGRARDELIALADHTSTGLADVRNATYGIGGHLIPVMLCGTDTPFNVVPVSKTTNDKMGEVERDIGKALSPRWVEIEILGYHTEDGRDSRVPKGFRYKVYSTSGRPGPTATPLKTYPDVLQSWLQVGPQSLPQKSVALVKKLKTGMKFGWKIEDVTSAGSTSRPLTFLAKHLPPVSQRPLAFLDYMLIAYNGVGQVDETAINNYIKGIKLGEGFDAWSRSLAIWGNTLANNNWLKSDAYGKKTAVIETSEGPLSEYHENLIAGGGLNAPHVDHIVPQSLLGPNCFSNAQITSMQYNVQKGKQTAVFEFKSPEWREEMLKKLTADPKLSSFM